MQDLHELPKLRDSLSYVYVEHAIVDRDQHAIELVSKTGRTHVPAAALCVLLLGPGTSITHAAVKLLAEHGCTALWTGEDGMRMYAQGSGETRRAQHLLWQAELHCDKEKRTQVVLRMYRRRFDVDLDAGLSLPQIRGMEGARVRSVYAQASKEYGVLWHGRLYDPHQWGQADPINRALSAANALLNGICHAAIVSGGYSPGLGFVHTGRYLSFVYDIADLYKTEITIPIAFQMVSESDIQVDKRVRQACRQRFYETKLLERILPDIDELLEIHPGETEEEGDTDGEGMLAAPIWEELLDEPGQMAWS
jgi:CRISPR-associated protein Cas1